MSSHHNDIDIDERDAADPPPKVRHLLDRVGASERVRVYRNAMVFLVADRAAKESMRERIRADLAATGLVGDSKRMEAFSPEVRSRLRNIADQAKLEARVAVARCFKHLYVPWSDRAAGYLRHIELSPKAQGEADKAQTKVIVQALVDESKLRTQRIATDYLKSKAWPKDTEQVATAMLAEAFWRDHGAQLIIDPTLLRDAVREGFATAHGSTTTPNSSAPGEPPIRHRRSSCPPRPTFTAPPRLSDSGCWAASCVLTTSSKG